MFYVIIIIQVTNLMQNELLIRLSFSIKFYRIERKALNKQYNEKSMLTLYEPKIAQKFM